jgi:hypothetical protein
MDEPFAPAPDPTGGLSLAPQGPLSALDLGIPAPLAQVVGPQPTLPTPPPVAPLPLHAPGPIDPKQQLLAIAALGAMLGGGPRSGIATGFGQGTANMLAAAQAKKDAEFKQQQAQEEKLRVQLETQQRAEAQRQADRQKQLQTALTQMHARVANIPDKATYDNEISGYANILQAAGYRGLDANWLRQAVPYVAPSAEKIAGNALDSFLKNPANTQLIQQHPEQLSKVVLTLDVDGDGIPEQVPLLRVAQIAKKPFAVDQSGALISYPKGTTADDQANANGFFQSLLGQAKAEGKNTEDATVRLELQKQAFKMAEDLKAKPPTDKLVKVEHKDDSTGKTVIEYLPESEVRGKKFDKGDGAVVENRLSSAKAVLQTGNDIIAAVSDPKVAKNLGVAMGRFNSAADFFGNPPPEFSKLKGQIESLALANMGVHGMRSNGGAEDIKQLLGVGRHTPASIIATIQGLNSFATHLLENDGQKVDQAQSGAGPSDDVLAAAAAKLRNRGR